MRRLFLVVFLAFSSWFLLQATNGCPGVEVPKRAKVPGEQVDWSEPFPSYDPPYWSAPCLHEHCDCEINSTEPMKFNKKDGNVDRRMVRRMNRVLPKYKVSNGLPLNPFGRTGLAGRGYLPRWGPTHLVKVILVRKLIGTVAFLKALDELPFMDDAFAAVVDNPSSNKLSKRVVAAVKKSSRFREKTDAAERVLRKAEKSAVKVAAETMPSPFDTDNAWVELSVYVIPCRKSAKFCTAVMEDREIAKNYNWSLKLDESSFHNMLGMFQGLKNESKGNHLHHKTMEKQSPWKAVPRKYKRELSFAVTTIAACATGAGLLAGFSTAGLSVIIGT
ncbi:hypothetical protein M514_02939, partial [Trichuris suis]